MGQGIEGRSERIVCPRPVVRDGERVRVRGGRAPGGANRRGQALIAGRGHPHPHPLRARARGEGKHSFSTPTLRSCPRSISWGFLGVRIRLFRTFGPPLLRSSVFVRPYPNSVGAIGHPRAV